MEKIIHISEFIWRGLTVRVSYIPDKFKSYKEAYGYPLAHLEIMTINPKGAPLPITETGYKSCYPSPEDVEAQGGPVEFVRAELDYAAQSPFWKEKENAAKQMSLF